jgi:hypothetical protein
MAVNGIGQAQLVNANQVNLEPAQRTQNAAAKTQTAANHPTRLTQENQAQGTGATANAENNAGREQGYRQNAQTNEGQGTRVNLYA